jgi:hypothetical protein
MAEGLMRRDDVQIDFYGSPEPSVDYLSHACGLDGVATQRGMVGRDEALAAERRAQLLLLVLSSSAKDAGTIPGKVFEYLAARRPIVAVGSVRGEVADLLAATKSGTQATSVKEMRELILAAYHEYVDDGRVSYRCDEDAVEQFSQIKIAKIVADALNYACDVQVPRQTRRRGLDNTGEGVVKGTSDSRSQGTQRSAQCRQQQFMSH